LQLAGVTRTIAVRRYPGFNPTAPNLSFTLTGAGLDSPSLGVHTWDGGGGADRIYLTFAELTPPSCRVWLLGRSDYGATVATFQVVAQSPVCTGSAPNTAGPLSERLLQGPAVAGGPGTQVLVCWYDAGIDGNSTPVQTFPPVPPTPVAPLNKFNIACRSSN